MAAPSARSPRGQSPSQAGGAGRPVEGGAEGAALPQKPKLQQHQSQSQQQQRTAAVVERSAAECAERAALFASRAQEKGVNPLRAVLLALLSDRPLTLKAIKRSIEEMPRQAGRRRELRDAAEEAARSQGASLDRHLKDIAQLKAPGRYHLRTTAERECQELEKDPSQPASAARGVKAEGARKTSPGEPATPQPPVELKSMTLQTKPPVRSAEAPRVAAVLPQRAAQQQQQQQHVLEKEKVKEASRGSIPGPALDVFAPGSGDAASPGRKRAAEEGRGEMSIKKKKKKKREAERPASAGAPASSLSDGRREGAAHSASHANARSLPNLPQGPRDGADAGKPSSRDAAREEDLAGEEAAERFLDAWDDKPRPQPGPVASHSQLQEHCSRYERVYPVYLRLHKMLARSGVEFRELEQQWKAAPNPASKAKMEDRLWEFYRLRYERFALTHRVFMALHTELGAIKHELKIYQDAIDRSGKANQHIFDE